MIEIREVLQLTTTITVAFDDAATVDYVKKVRRALQHGFQSASLRDIEGGEYSSLSINHQLELVMKDYD